MNWALYIVTEPGGEVDPGEAGVFLTSMNPGMGEAPYGVLFVAPKEWVDSWLKANYPGWYRNPPDQTKQAILAWFKENYA